MAFSDRRGQPLLRDRKDVLDIYSESVTERPPRRTIRAINDVLDLYSETLADEPRRRTIRAIIGIIIVLLIVFLGPLAVQKAVLWAISDVKISGETGATGAQGSPGADGAAGRPGAQGFAGPAGADGVRGRAGATGADGATGAQGIPGEQGTAGPQGPAGENTPISIGQGSGQVASCDDDITPSLRSRWNGSELTLKTITFKNVSSTCGGLNLTVYVVGNGDELIDSFSVNAVNVSDGRIEMSRSDFGGFDDIPSIDIHQIVIEMAG